MNKHLLNICGYSKALITSNNPDKFTIADRFKYCLTDDELQKGITAYRNFLHSLFDFIANNTAQIDVARGKKYDPDGTKGDRGTSSVKEHFPVFFDIAMILLSLGFHG